MEKLVSCSFAPFTQVSSSSPSQRKLGKVCTACHIVCRPCITQNEAMMAHKLLHEFVIGVVELYGPEMVTPNMHLHLHLKDSIQDFGPIYAFWLYGFERLNGDIKKMTVNYKTAFEVTYMKKFLSVIHYGDYIRNLPQGIKQNPVMMSSFGYLLPTPSDSLVASTSAPTCFDFSLFVNAPLRLNDTFNGAELLPPDTQTFVIVEKVGETGCQSSRIAIEANKCAFAGEDTSPTYSRKIDLLLKYDEKKAIDLCSNEWKKSKVTNDLKNSSQKIGGSMLALLTTYKEHTVDLILS
ncbi:hypothetical protein G6F62_012368 [Rhizopus arrhizus]|uniref:Uncharacterized protein n=1 Tax=Rhizopus oryzae TaxID=64495 RepID=A0A9P6WW53_RHIOR|nr:hypothetical protein G6F22_014034 [Rhizopus arrhizus]KAG1297743.1 hypothetical protein G6F64_013030 [Rhizopus arrhizus]KAG1318417.1 hypothetical protein G6F62_012368 [Rhizopus arrhizus]